MWSKTAGIVIGVAIFFVYFAIVGTNPVLETLLGVVLALAGGGGVWWYLEYRAGAARSVRK